MSLYELSLNLLFVSCEDGLYSIYWASTLCGGQEESVQGVIGLPFICVLSAPRNVLLLLQVKVNALCVKLMGFN